MSGSYTLEEQREFDALVEHQTVQRLARRIVSASTVDQTAGEALIGAQAAVAASGAHLDDGAAPGAPAGVEAVAVPNGIYLTWSEPSDLDAVDQAIISVTKVSDSTSRNHRTRASAHEVTGLLREPYTVTVTFRDQFNLIGTPSPPITVTPAPTVADEIGAATQAMGQNFSDLLNNPALASFTSADKLANATIETLQRASAGEFLADDVISSRLLATWNLAAANAVLGTAVISSAKIETLVVDKLRAGSFSAGNIDLIGSGAIRAGGGKTILDATGLRLTSLGSGVARASENVTFKISPVESNDSAIWFYGTSTVRGITLRADGDPGGAETQLRLHTTRNGDDALASSCRLLLNSFGANPGTVYVGTDLSVDRDAAVAGQLDVLGPLQARGGVGVTGDLGVTGRMSAAGGMVFSGGGGITPNRAMNPTDMGPNTLLTLTHDLGFVPKYVFPQWQEGVRWVDMVHGVDNWRVSSTNATVNVWNDAPSTRRVRLNIIL